MLVLTRDMAKLKEPNQGNRLSDAIKQAKFGHTRLLVDGGADVNFRTDRGESPLILATCNIVDSSNRSKFVRLLLKNGADPNFQDNQGQTALMHAAILGHFDVSSALLEHNKTELGIQDNEGNSALMYAAAFGHNEIVAQFVEVFKDLKKHLNLQQKNNQGLGACQLASRNGHEACVRLLTRDAQLFPSAMPDAFPDPKELERAPTPTKKKSNKGVSKLKVKTLTSKEKKYVTNSIDMRLRSDSIGSTGMSGNEADTESMAVSAAVRNSQIRKKHTNVKKSSPMLITASPTNFLSGFSNSTEAKIEIGINNTRISTPREKSSSSLPKLNLNSSIASTKSDTGAFRMARTRSNTLTGSGKLSRRAMSEPRGVNKHRSDMASSSDETEMEELHEFLMSSSRSESSFLKIGNDSTSKQKNSSVRLPPIRFNTKVKDKLQNKSHVKGVSDIIDEEHETSASETEKGKIFKRKQIRRKVSHKK